MSGDSLRGKSEMDMRVPGHGNHEGAYGAVGSLLKQAIGEPVAVEGDALFQGIFENAGDVIFLVARDGSFTSFSSSLLAVTGWEVCELVGQPFLPLVHPDDVALALDTFGRALAGEATPFVAIRTRRKTAGYVEFEIGVTPLSNHPTAALVGVARDVTLRNQQQRELEFKNVVLATQQETSLDGILVVSEGARVVSCNRQFREIWGIPEEMIQAGDDCPVLEACAAQVVDEEQFRRKVAFLYDHSEDRSRDEIRLKDGRIIERYSACMVGAAGERFGRVWYFRDITDQLHTTYALRRANRALRVLSGVNQALVREEGEEALLLAVCRVLVDVGGYKLAWIGSVEHDEFRSIQPRAQFGLDGGFANGLQVSWADNEQGRGPSGAAVRTGLVQICRDILMDQQMAPWRERAVRRGLASSIALPLGEKDNVFAVISIYAVEPDAFDTEECALLQELANDLTLGILRHRLRVEHQRAEERAERLANFDTLTDLPNAAGLTSHLQGALQLASASAQQLFLMNLQVDRFSDIQDAVGIAGASDLLATIASRLGEVAGDCFLARIGGESFALVPNACDAVQARGVAERVLAVWHQPFEHMGISIDLQATIGAAVYPLHGTDADTLLARSAIAVRNAREAGLDYGLYSGRSDTESPERLALLAELRQSIKSDGLLLHYQPKISSQTGEICGVEALVRWRHPERGMVPPGDFIPLAERTGLIKPITYWVLDAALRCIAQWRAAGIEIPIAVNVSAINLRDPEFLDRVIELGRQWPDELRLLAFELTETALMSDPARAHEMLSRIGALGVRVFIDDFGTGYSSLSYIATLPIHALKIDRSFVEKMTMQAEHRAVVAATISLAHSLGLKVVAEGIETDEQLDLLIRQGCDEIQGYYFSHPLPAEDFLRWRAQFAWRPEAIAGRQSR
jgi:PAS domain S-box-containing protein/diguanylate cyclase (GGDEF)-like protein